MPKNLRDRLSLVSAQFRVFAAVNGELVRAMFATRPWTVAGVLALDGLSVATRIATLALLSVIAGAFGGDGRLSFAGWTIRVTGGFAETMVLALGIGVISLVGAWAAYETVRRSRSLGRHINEIAMERVLQRTCLLPTEAMHAAMPPVDLNRMLTQNSIHTGLAAETLLKLVNPLGLFLVSWLLLGYLSISIAFLILLAGLVFLPFYLRQSYKVQTDVKEFYSIRADGLAGSIAQTATVLSGQLGMVPEMPAKMRLGRMDAVHRFLDGLDRNILANEWLGLSISIASAILVPIVLLTLGLLTARGQMTISTMVAFIGGFVYLTAATRTVSSHATNLLRFFPQVHALSVFVGKDGLVSAPRTDEASVAPEPGATAPLKPVVLSMPGGARMTVAPCERLGLIADRRVSRLELPGLLLPLLEAGLDRILLPRLCFVAGSYRFPVGGTVANMLTGTEASAAASLPALLERFGIAAEIAALPQQLDTIMSEAIWQGFSGSARGAARLIPLMLKPDPKLVLIDWAAISHLNAKHLPSLLEPFARSFVVIVLQDANCPAGLAEKFLAVRDHHTVGLGDREWLEGWAVREKRMPTPQVDAVPTLDTILT